MAYEKHTWECGETITEAKLNNIEDGIEEALECCEGGESSGGALLLESYTREATSDECEAGGTTKVYNYTWQEAYDAMLQGKYFYMVDPEQIKDMTFTIPMYIVNFNVSDEPLYGITIQSIDGVYRLYLVALSPDDYLMDVSCSAE